MRTPDIRKSLGAILLLLLGACTTARPSAPPSTDFSLLVFGDHGYDLEYLEEKDRVPVRTREQAIEYQRKKWISEKRPPNEFQPPSLVVLPSTGGYVPATGMMLVANAMRSYCESARCDAAVMLGDNIYPNGPTGGADGVPDAVRFDRIFRKPFGDFGRIAPDFRIYAVLGNHDWRTSREAAFGEVRYLETTRPFYMDGIRYRVQPPAAHGDVEIFALDTEVLLGGTTVYDDALADDGSELPPAKLTEPAAWSKPASDEERLMVEWLERSLRESKARWKIVIGHHPLWSSAGSKFEDARAMRRLILPTLCRYADMYLAGHEHTLEVHTDDCSVALPGETVAPLPQLVSGAGAKHRPVNSWFQAHQLRKSPELASLYTKGIVWGFMHVAFHDDRAMVSVVTTPNDGSGGTAVEYTQTFTRRSMRQ